ncbi:aminotransferase class I/II-fold pyridoxal phosphate-dependent enzyme [Desulfothermobacter acidiphilus]|uniref:aminotransferase class I/II-fold pyridoxal phosphate-dependent enzyme n=1 Tax=Desulfothermobacter acidiphilus TaxID=1938353 RepID=UPI003F8936C5
MLRARQPLVTALKRYCRQARLAFHTPGHHGGRAAPPVLRSWWGPAVWASDLTELPELGEIHTPSGPVAEAQRLAAAWAGVSHSFFLVNGSSVGVAALLLATLRQRERVLLPRALHRSAVTGLCLSGAEPVFIPSVWEPEWNLLLPPRPAAYRERLQQVSGIRAIFCLYPDYYGLAVELESLAKEARSRGLPLLVDAAHAGFFGLHPSLPPRPTACGAEAVVESGHKRLCALTQTAWLHLRGELLSEAQVREALALLQTTSPSYLLMASLDAARAYWSGERARRRLEEFLGWVREARERLAALPGVKVLCQCPGYQVDPTRLVLNLTALGLKGREVAEELRLRGVVAEMADANNVLLFPHPGSGRRQLARLVEAVRRLARQRRDRQPLSLPFPSAPLVLLPGEAWRAPARWLPLAEAVGRTAAGVVTVTPPGIPILLPGEKITPEVVEYLQWARSEGTDLQGVAGHELEVKVVS